MSDKIRELQDKFLIVSNQIVYQLQMFEAASKIDEKRQKLEEVRKLFKKLEENVL